MYQEHVCKMTITHSILIAHQNTLLSSAPCHLILGTRWLQHRSTKFQNNKMMDLFKKWKCY